MATAVKEDTFAQEVLKSEEPVIVDFWAEWCGPCHAVAPVLDKIVAERQGELKLVKVNIDEVEQAHPVHEHDRSAEPASEREDPEADEREDVRGARDVALVEGSLADD